VSGQATAGGFVPELGQRVTVRRWLEPSASAGGGLRTLHYQVTGALAGLDRRPGSYMKLILDPASVTIAYHADGEADPAVFAMICTSRVHLPETGQLVTEVLPATDEVPAPEAEPAVPAARGTDIFRRQVAPGLTVAYDASGTPVLEVSGPGGHALLRVTVPSAAALVTALEEGRNEAAVLEAAADKRRYRGPDEKRRAEGRLTQTEAVNWLAAKASCSRGFALANVKMVAGGAAVHGMTYDGTYWIVPAAGD
jgi:hypothetical protein